MKNVFICFCILLVILSCNDKNIPDVSGIRIDIKTLRFEKDFFSMDTNHLVDGLQQLKQKYPGFANDFISNILGLDIPGLMDAGSPQSVAIKVFLKDYRALKDSSDKVFGDFEKEAKGIK